MAERLHRIVGGQKIYLSADEEAALRADWLSNEQSARKEIEAAALAEKRAAALRALQERQLREAATSTDAPTEVRDYANALLDAERR